ncbi:CASP-like protein 5A1 [Punica granatum]|uniref:CASP-like protein n=2 Tax=Punica granatum TaxID=22663 RepID=A0A218WAP5_PUNGR|nr:CASP-like protein 5A1 [Punica granatum]OWM69716.1 hypothetical protein CDL15_Pgr025565 [Punica granatum]PKI68141.1 hypothetical protein CRG98_011440 [Punica granatum]
MSRPAVHPVEAPPPTYGAVLPRVRMKNVQGTAGTAGSFVLRLFQFAFAAISVCVMGTTSDFVQVTAFRYLVSASIFQSLWSLSLALIDIYAILVKRSLRNTRLLRFLMIGDAITSTLTFASASASAGITVLIGNDLNKCAVNNCARFQTATAMAFLSWFAASPSFFLIFWSLASH